MCAVKYTGYFDGSLRLNTMYYGWIVYDDIGEVVEKFGAGVQESINTTNVAEYYGLRSLLRWIRANDIQNHFHIFGDSQLIVRQIEENYKSRADHLNQLCRECRKILSRNIELTWVPRAYNEADPCTRAIVMNPQEVKFWRTTEFYGAFSNFARYPVTINQIWYATVEHYYQAMKCADIDDARRVRLASTPKEAKLIAQSVKMREDWGAVKYEIMLNALRHKVRQHPDVRTLLLSTGDARLVENSPYDYIWGCGKDGTGTNLLGLAWMQVRDEIKDSK